MIRNPMLPIDQFLIGDLQEMDGYEEGRFISLYILFANLKIKNIMSLLYYWGKPITKTLFQRNGNDQNVVAFDKEITQLACGENHAIVVMDRNAYGFGDNSEGQLGDSTEDGELGIRRITILNNNKIKQVSCGWNHTLILDQTGAVYSSGRGDHGELGRGKMGNFHTFELVLKGVKQISAGKDHSLALCGSKVMGWGNSKQGQLGLLTKKYYYYPHELNAYPTVFVFAGSKYSLFVTSKGVYGTGMNQNCQLGLGHENDVQVPRKLSIDEEIVSISGGNYCAAKTNKGQWYLWGSGGFGVFKYPTKMSFLTGGESVAMGLNFGLLSRNGQVWVWGNNKWGELGIDQDCKDYAYQASDISNLNLKAFSCGYNFMIGYTNERQNFEHSFSNHEREKLSECNEEEQSSISRELFKNFKSSSGQVSSNTFKDRNEGNEWNKFYEIQHEYDLIDVPVVSKKDQLSQGSSQFQKPSLITKKIHENPICYKTWQGGNDLKRRVKLSESLKTLTNYQWTHLDMQNKQLKERLQNQRLEKEKMREQYLHMLNMNEDNKIYNKILKLESKIHSKHSSQSNHSKNAEFKQFDSFSKKLASLKHLLQNANE